LDVDEKVSKTLTITTMREVKSLVKKISHLTATTRTRSSLIYRYRYRYREEKQRSFWTEVSLREIAL